MQIERSVTMKYKQSKTEFRKADKGNPKQVWNIIKKYKQKR